MAMSNAQMYCRTTARSQGPFRGSKTHGPIIDQEGRKIPAEALGPQVRGFQFDFGNSTANPFANLTREQRLTRLDAVAKLLAIAFMRPGTNIPYGLAAYLVVYP